MSLKLILFIFLFLIQNLYASDWKNFQLINGCAIYSSKGESVKSFPGSFCQFLENGHYLTANNISLKLQSPTNQTVWEFKSPFHHQLNLSQDKSRILALNYQLGNDLLRVLSLRDGNVLYEISAAEIFKQIKHPEFRYSPFEKTHFNSFYEIPTMQEGLKLPEYIKAGNYILNSYGDGYYILSADLKKVLHFEKLKSSQEHTVHDVQILPNGKLLYFNNIASTDDQLNLYSSIDEIDLTNNELNVLFSANPKPLFFSRHCGGAQYLDQEHILFSHMLTGTYVYNVKTKTLVSNIFSTHFQNRQYYPSQQVKAQDLREFLKFWK